MENRTNLIDLLNYIDPKGLNYQEWLSVGMALKSEGYDLSEWKKWSSTDTDKYDPKTCDIKWESFKRDDITGGTLVKMAQDRGWSPEPKLKVYMSGTDKYRKTFSWDENFIQEEEPKFKEPTSWNPVKDLIRYLEVMFDPSDTIGYTMVSVVNNKGKYVPIGKGSYTHQAGQMIDMLKNGEPVEKVFGSYDKNGGAWIRVNPLDGKGIDDKNVVRYSNLLIECDNMPIEEQIENLEKIKIPIKAMVYSGSKSVHAIIPVNAKSETDYRFSFNFIKNILHEAGMEIDSANINPSRLTRLPGVMRGNHKQFLIQTNTGMQSFEDWKSWISAMNDGLPDIVNLASVWGNLPPLKPELISGILRQGHKMIIASTSKAGKTFILMELAMAIAEGMEWIGHKCKQGKILYINMELDSASFMYRFDQIYTAFNKQTNNHVRNIDMWNLRGHGKPLNDLTPLMINRMRNQDYLAVMIDPLYKVMDGDENSNSDVARMVSAFDKIAEETGASVIYAHHFAKGSSANKSIIDRAAGAGTFARDPDAILTMTQLDWIPEEEKESGWTAWRIESTLREFKAIDPVNLFFDFPVHKVDESGRLADCEFLSNENNKRSKIVLHNQKDEIESMINGCEKFEMDEYTCFRIADLQEINEASANPMKRPTLYKRLSEAGYESMKPYGKQGFWGRIE